MDILAIINIVMSRTTIEATICIGVATPIIILNGIQNGAEIGNMEANTFKLLVGFIIVKYAK